VDKANKTLSGLSAMVRAITLYREGFFWVDLEGASLRQTLAVRLAQQGQQPGIARLIASVKIYCDFLRWTAGASKGSAYLRSWRL
jgi:hypothetical protein